MPVTNPEGRSVDDRHRRSRRRDPVVVGEEMVSFLGERVGDALVDVASSTKECSDVPFEQSAAVANVDVGERFAWHHRQVGVIVAAAN